LWDIYLTQLIDKICEATKDKKQYIQMAKFISLAVCPIQFFSNVFDLSCNVLAIIHRITGDILSEGVLPPGRDQ
jgi:hypothetical protein